MKITISPCTPDHLPAIKEACKNTFEEHRKRQPFAFSENVFELAILGGFETAFIPVDENYAPVGKTPSDKSENLFVAFLDDDLAGYIFFDLNARPQFIDTADLYITDICVFDAFQKQGVGHALLKFAKELCDTQKRDNLRATVWAGNTASETMFQNCGFTVMNQNFRYGPTSQTRPIPEHKTPVSKQTLYPAWMFWSAIAVAFFSSFIAPRLAGF